MFTDFDDDDYKVTYRRAMTGDLEMITVDPDHQVTAQVIHDSYTFDLWEG